MDLAIRWQLKTTRATKASRISRKSESVFNLISDSRDLTRNFLPFLIENRANFRSETRRKSGIRNYENRFWFWWNPILILVKSDIRKDSPSKKVIDITFLQYHRRCDVIQYSKKGIEEVCWRINKQRLEQLSGISRDHKLTGSLSWLIYDLRTIKCTINCWMKDGTFDRPVSRPV